MIGYAKNFSDSTLLSALFKELSCVRKILLGLNWRKFTKYLRHRQSAARADCKIKDGSFSVNVS